nr:hypothetical protein [uncultured Draconibacterium sp.]
MTDVQCIDSVENKFTFNFKYSTFNPEKMSFGYVVPDSIPNSDFYNAFAGSIISAYYNLINSDTTSTYEELLQVNKFDKKLVEENVMKYCQQNKTWNEIFKLAESSFYENEKVNKTKFPIDSLVNISMSYFDIAGYSAERGFAFHFVCGENPFEFKPENAKEILICDFCQEALKNEEMMKTHTEITDSIGKLIKYETENFNDFPKIKMIYEPKLHKLMKESNVLKESLIAYYEKRKNIEPFILEY